MKRRMIQCATAVNRDAIRRESINGVEHIIVSSFTLPDDVVMNGGLYPADEIERGFHTLERTLAPVEHPTDSQGNFISASDPEAIHNFHAGAFNCNVARENGRVHIEKFINVQEALKTDRGRRLLDRIDEIENNEKPRPVHTSVGVYIEVEELDGPMTNAAGDEYQWIAREMIFDHDAILLDSVGAAQPHQGVGMAVNRNGDEIEAERVILSDNTVRPATDLPLADGDRRWSSGQAVKRVMKAVGAEDEPNTVFGRYHLWFDGENADQFGAYKLPFVDIIDGEPHAIPNALRNAAARLDQTDGPTDAEKVRIRGVIDGYLKKLEGNQQSLSDLHRAVYTALEKGPYSIQWIEELFPTDVVFGSGDELFTVPFAVDEETGIVTIVGIPVPVDRNITYAPKVNSEEGDAMKELILNALKQAGVETDGLDDAALFDAYNQLQANQSEGDGAGAGNGDAAGVAEAVANALKPVTDKLDALEGKLNQKDEAEHTRLAGVVANSGKYPGLDEESAKLLPVDKLKAMAANCGTAYGIPLTVNSGSDDVNAFKTEMPE